MKLFTAITVSFALILGISGCSRAPQDAIYNDAPQVERDKAELEVIQSLRNSDNLQRDLYNHYGGSLESRIRADFQSRGTPLSANAVIQFLQLKDTQEIELETGDDKTISGAVDKGEAFIKVSNDPNYNGMYALACMNGMVSGLDSSSFRDAGFARDYPYRFTVEKGNGFTQELSNEEALQAASDIGLPVKSNKLNAHVVIVQPGYCLEKLTPTTHWRECQ